MQDRILSLFLGSLFSQKRQRLRRGGISRPCASLGRRADKRRQFLGALKQVAAIYIQKVSSFLSRNKRFGRHGSPRFLRDRSNSGSLRLSENPGACVCSKWLT